MNYIEYILLFVSICILLFFLWGYIRYPKLKNYKIEKYVNVKDIGIDNCDLIFFSGTTFPENMCKWLGDCIFSHIGLLVKEGDIIYILECDIGQSHKKGVRVIPLEKKLAKFKGDKIGCVKKLYGNIPLTNKIVNVMQPYLSCGFYNNIWKWLAADHISKRENETKLFCCELVSVILQKLNILSLEKPPYWYTPGYYFKNNIKLLDNYFYGENLFFKF